VAYPYLISKCKVPPPSLRRDKLLVKMFAYEVKVWSNIKKWPCGSAEEHQDRLARCPDDYCHIPEEILNKYK